MKVFFIELPFIKWLELVVIPNLYLKNLYFKSLRWFCCIPLIHDLINIFTLKPSIFDKKFNFLEK
ncbi:hypothetical protein HPCPY1124_1080 [Helicobacter pylori CPY1124]|nr:hypothetical protein HPCPY1124_1080 [Helicobacter pylori CPY1124]GHR19497.1 hypothetical protein JP0093_00080 [Helicobacter pylori]